MNAIDVPLKRVGFFQPFSIPPGPNCTQFVCQCMRILYLGEHFQPNSSQLSRTRLYDTYMQPQALEISFKAL